MSGSRELAEHIQDLLAPLDGLRLRRFFGGWALTHQGTQFAIVMDTLYLRVDDRLRARLRRDGSQPFRYRSAGREVTVERYYSAPASSLDRSAALLDLARDAIRATRGEPNAAGHNGT